MSEYIQYLAELIPEKDSLKLVKMKLKNFIKHILLTNVSAWGMNCINLITFKYKSGCFPVWICGSRKCGCPIILEKHSQSK